MRLIQVIRLKFFLECFRRLLIGLSCALLATVSFAQTKVVVVPMSGDDAKPLANVITVAKSNGDYTSPIQALASINDASAVNPYLLVIAPGVYNLGDNTLFMKPYIEIAGSGANATFLSGSVSGAGIVSSAAQIVSSDHSSIRDLTVKNTGGSNSIIGILNESVDFVIANVHIEVTGSGTAIGVTNSGDASTLKILNSKISATADSPIAVVTTTSAGVTMINTTDLSAESSSGGAPTAISDSGSGGVKLLNSSVDSAIQNALLTDRFYCASSFFRTSSALGMLFQEDCTL